MYRRCQSFALKLGDFRKNLFIYFFFRKKLTVSFLAGGMSKIEIEIEKRKCLSLIHTGDADAEADAEAEADAT